MDQEEFDAELSSDDSDYNPLSEKHKNESASENSEPDEIDQENSDEDCSKKKAGKRKKFMQRGSAKKPAPSAQIDENLMNKEVDPDEEKRRSDALWAEFLGETDDKPLEPKANGSSSKSTSTETSTSTKPIPKASPAPASTLKSIFEFAGEAVEIPTKSAEPAEESPAAASKPLLSGVKRPAGGGLGSVLDQLTKKTKLTVLEKTKLDWDGFKDNEGISEELQTHNRGRDGFLQRRDFLQRTDVRQFEIEKSLRLTGRRK